MVEKTQESLYCTHTRACVRTCVRVADSRHSHVAAIYDDVSEVRTSRLIRQLQIVGCPQWLMETSQTSHWRRWGVICRRSPWSKPMKPHVADGLIGRRWGPVDWLRWLETTITKWLESKEESGDMKQKSTYLSHKMSCTLMNETIKQSNAVIICKNTFLRGLGT